MFPDNEITVVSSRQVRNGGKRCMLHLHSSLSRYTHYFIVDSSRLRENVRYNVIPMTHSIYDNTLKIGFLIKSGSEKRKVNESHFRLDVYKPGFI